MQILHLVAWFAEKYDLSDIKITCSIAGNLTEEQSRQACEWLEQIGKWTDENREVEG